MLLHNNTCISVCGCRRRRNAKKTRGITILANVRLNTQRCTVTTKHNHDNMFVVVAKYVKYCTIPLLLAFPVTLTILRDMCSPLVTICLLSDLTNQRWALRSRDQLSANHSSPDHLRGTPGAALAEAVHLRTGDRALGLGVGVAHGGGCLVSAKVRLRHYRGSRVVTCCTWRWVAQGLSSSKSNR